MPDWLYRNQVVTTHLHISNAPVELCRWRKDADTTIGISDKPDFLSVSSEREIFAAAVIIFTSPDPNAAAAFCRHAEQIPELLSLLDPSWLIFGEQNLLVFAPDFQDPLLDQLPDLSVLVHTGDARIYPPASSRSSPMQEPHYLVAVSKSKNLSFASPFDQLATNHCE